MKKAFTLVEIMVSVALMAVLTVGVNTYFISSLRSARKAATNATVKSEGEQIQANIVQSVKFAKRINSCTATSLSLLASDGSDVVFQVNANRMQKTTDNPAPTPDVSAYLSSTKTSIRNCGVGMFVCTTAGKTVDVCFDIYTSTGDITDSSSMTFRNYIYTEN